MRAAAGETEEPAAEETDHHEDTHLNKSCVEVMMLYEREVEDKVRIQLTEAEVEFTSEGVNDGRDTYNAHELKGAGDG